MAKNIFFLACEVSLGCAVLVIGGPIALGYLGLTGSIPVPAKVGVSQAPTLTTSGRVAQRQSGPCCREVRVRSVVRVHLCPLFF